MSRAGTWLGIGILWLLQPLPLRFQAFVGACAGELVRLAIPRRRRIVERNLALCFPELTPTAQAALCRAHFRAASRAVLEHGLLAWASEARLRRLIRVRDEAHLLAARPNPVILLAPHFVGLDMGGTRYTLDHAGVSVYSRIRNPLVDRLVHRIRARFNAPLLVARQDGIRAAIRPLKNGLPLYLLPDQDFGARDSLFVPFFGEPAATLPVLARLAQLTGARVVPLVTQQLPGGHGYEARYYPAWENFPSGDLHADTLRMNNFIEARVREMPEQYFWAHRRFKTRPPGAAPIYD
jgi:KDO2-lipid IV(A) lauroyltransferase